MVDGVSGDLDDEATSWVQTQLARFRLDIDNATGATRDAFRQVQEQTTSPEVVGVDLRANLTAPTKDRHGVALRTYPGHLYADASGDSPPRSTTGSTPS